MFREITHKLLYPPTNPAWGDEKPLCSLNRGAKSVSPSPAVIEVEHLQSSEK